MSAILSWQTTISAELQNSQRVVSAGSACSALNVVFLLSGALRFDEPDRVTFGIFEDAQRHAGHHRPRQHRLAAKLLRMLERPRDIRRLDVERHPRATARIRRTD